MSLLPEKFISAMKTQLPESEWEAFFAVYEKPPFKGLRVNPLKISASDFQKISPFSLRPVAWEKNGFYVEEEKIGAHPYHFAGLYYSQEPSAMCAAPLLGAQAGERVLDLCSAPGGKGTQLAAEMGGKGLLVLNEPISSRAHILSQNVERMGIKNAVVLSALPEVLSTCFQGYFDKILVDAPCSGEGMFRKNAEEALKEWSEENVDKCVERQKKILSEATKMLAVGGRLVYSTCTFSTAEDEGQVCDHLKNHPEMRLIESKKLYPHKVDGEGHFAALFEKGEGAEEPISRLGEQKGSVSKQSEKIYRDFEKGFFRSSFADRIYEAGGILYALPEGIFELKGLPVLRAGVRLGEVVNGRFEPSHSLAMSAKKSECKNVVDIPLNDTRTEKFLRGESIESEDVKNGWCLVCIDGYPVGFGKAVNGVVKNHIPKPLRLMKR